MAWETKRETVYRLYRDGKPIVDGDGTPIAYASEEEAQHVAASWDLLRAPTLDELRAMSDEELEARTVVIEHFYGIKVYPPKPLGEVFARVRGLEGDDA